MNSVLWMEGIALRLARNIVQRYALETGSEQGFGIGEKVAHDCRSFGFVHVRAFAEEHIRCFHDRFRQRRMGVDRHLQVRRECAHLNGKRPFRD